MKQIAILGRQHKLATAELSVRLNGDIQPLNPGYVALNTPLEHPDTIGGIVRLVESLGVIKKLELYEIFEFVFEHINQTPPEDSGKINLGIDTGHLTVSHKKLQSGLLTLKKRLRSAGYSIRIIMPKNGTINAAQVKANKLASPGNYEITAIESKRGINICRTVWCQDVDAYSARDYGRPMRDGFVGMLPPKLTQTMINLTGLQPDSTKRILDPFCGTGVVLQESLLMGFQAYGTDMSEKMIEYTDGNIDWLRKEHPEISHSTTEVGDARNKQWKQPIDAVVTETYLGEPLSSTPYDAHLKQLRRESAQLLGSFLENLHRQIRPQTPVILAIPAWKTKKDTYIDSPVVDSINRLGYTRTSLEHISHQDLIYYRPDQYVARRILVLKRQ